MFCKICNIKKRDNKFRKNRKTCIKCEYTTRKTYLKKYRNEHRIKLNEYNREFQKSKNWYYVPKPKPICVPKINNKNLDLNITFDIYI